MGFSVSPSLVKAMNKKAVMNPTMIQGDYRNVPPTVRNLLEKASTRDGKRMGFQAFIEHPILRARGRSRIALKKKLRRRGR